MSYNTWVYYGVGIETTKINTTPEGIEHLLDLAPLYREKVHEFLNNRGIDTPTIDDYEEFDADDELGLATIIAGVMREAEGVPFVCCEDYDCNRFVIYETTFPWNMSEKELSLTEAKLKDIFNKYTSILTDEVISVEDQTVENGSD